jgi:hypothetical protein
MAKINIVGEHNFISVLRDAAESFDDEWGTEYATVSVFADKTGAVTVAAYEVGCTEFTFAIQWPQFPDGDIYDYGNRLGAARMLDYIGTQLDNRVKGVGR